MRTSPQGTALIRDFEKCSLTPYVDAVGVWTVGWGHALASPAGGLIRTEAAAREYMQVKFGSWVITQAQADALHLADLAETETQVLTGIGADNASQSQFDALVSLIFNIGPGNFKTSSVKRFHLANQRNIGAISMRDLYKIAIANAAPTNMAQAFVVWCRGGGKVLLGLFRRRLAELLLYSGWDAAKACALAETFTP